MATQSAKNEKEIMLGGDVAAEGDHEIAHEITLYAEPILHNESFNVTNAVFTSWVMVVFVLIISVILRSKLREVPGRLQSLFELVVEATIGLYDQITNDRKLTLRIFPVAVTVFIFVLLNNWLGIMPFGGFGIIENTDHGPAFIPFLRGSTADINTTLALAVMAVIGANAFGVFSIGLWKTFNKYVNLGVLGQVFTKFRKDPTVIIVAPITFFVGLIEIVGEFAKVASLSFRLFGNIFAGEVLLLSMAALAPYFIPIPFLFLEILVGVIQAAIFSILTVVYFTISASDHDHEDGHEESEHAEHPATPAQASAH